MPELDPAPEPGQPKSDPAPAARATAAGSAAPPQRGHLELAKLSLNGPTAVEVLLRLPGPGNASVTGAIKTRRGSLGVCKTSREISGAGEATLRCRLSDLARRRTKAHWLRVHLTVWFAPAGGALETIARKVVVPRIDRD